VPRIWLTFALLPGDDERNNPIPSFDAPKPEGLPDFAEEAVEGGERLNEADPLVIAEERAAAGDDVVFASRWKVLYSYLARIWRSMIESASSWETGGGCFLVSGLKYAFDFTLPFLRIVYVSLERDVKRSGACTHIHLVIRPRVHGNGLDLGDMGT